MRRPTLCSSALWLAASAAILSIASGSALARGGADCGTRKVRALSEFFAYGMNESSQASHADEASGLVRERAEMLRKRVSGEARTRIERYLDDSYDGDDRPTHSDILNLITPWIDEIRQSNIMPSCTVPESEAVITTDVLSVCRKVEATESHYLEAIGNRIRSILSVPTGLVQCDSVAALAPVRCHLGEEGIPTDTYYSFSFPEREARLRLDLDGYDSYLGLWKDVPREGKRFQFLICAQSSAMSPRGDDGSIGVQAVRGCARFDLKDLLRGEFHYSSQTTTQDNYVRAQSDWCQSS